MVTDFRVLQVAPFAGRIAALEELHMVLHNAASEFRQVCYRSVLKF